MTEQDCRYMIKKALDSRGLSVYALAKETCIDRGVIHRWLSGETRIRLDLFLKISNALDVKIGDESLPFR